MITLKSPVSELPGVGTIISKQLKRLGIEAVSDLLFYFPYKHLDFSVFSKIKDIHVGETVTIKVKVNSIANRFSFKNRTSLCEAVVSDDSGSLKVIWFNQPYIKDYLKIGDEVLLSGKTSFYKQLQLNNPIYEKSSEDTIHTGRIVPIYSVTENLYNKTLRRIIKPCLKLAVGLTDIVPQEISNKYSLFKQAQAIEEIHFPSSQNNLEKAKLKITFNEVFIQQLAIAKRKLDLSHKHAPSIKPEIELITAFLDSLPFTPTLGQKQAAWQIMKDLEGPKPTNRLLQGDVGSGKTLVAILTALSAIHQRKQVAILAPTEVLAKQHYDNIYALLRENKQFKKLVSAKIGLLTNTYKIINGTNYKKAEFYKLSEEGEIDLIIGTHALLFGLKFSDLSLIIIDEQHRFGVKQRSKLIKSMNEDTPPHLLSMTATPIPRTLALTLFSDLDISTLKEIPKNRKSIITKVVPEDGREQIYKEIKAELRKGRQAFIVTPRVEDTGASQTKSVKKEFLELSKKIFPEFKVGLLYGSMSGKEKETVMQAFNENKINILVSTSVIEVGIDVPNATCLVIEGAQNFGLAQLHQLRGRVGRGKEQSYCYLFSDSSDEKTLSRLLFFANSHDGFKLAEMDLSQRGFGDMFGENQSGFNFKFSRFITLKTLEIAKKAATELLIQDPELKKFSELKKITTEVIQKLHQE